MSECYFTSSPAMDGAKNSFLSLSEPNLENTEGEGSSPTIHFRHERVCYSRANECDGTEQDEKRD
jgi:hypothetical protein